MIKFICYPKCTTCQKALRWLDDNKIEYELRDIKEDNDFFTLHVFENNYGAVTFYENRGLIKKEESVHEDLGEVEYLMYYRKKKKEEE